jgi:hypothetical protein
MPETLTVIVERDGSATFIYDDRLAALFEGCHAKTRRASHVEPCADGWDADMTPVGGPASLGSFKTRGEALEAEVAYLLSRLEAGPLEAQTCAAGRGR